MNITLDLPEETQRFIEMQALAHQRSVEEEIVQLLSGMAASRRERHLRAMEQLKLLQAKILAERGGVPFPDSTPLIRESREHDH